ncbi:MAG: tripartite tricarboxylate transporter substrate binding protein [Alphaproteobacteria bacterium]|nr:tripartite tricarboxylate transporter substrate binding protein [Alphaproteobacteria bacterium]
MTRPLSRRTALAALVATGTAVAGLARPAIAQAPWPQRGPIRLIATFPPGGLADIVARITAQGLSQALGQTVVVENRAGAGGTIGAEMAARAAPDGYTLVLSHFSPFAVAAGTYTRLSYNPMGDFTHIAFIGESPNLVLVRGDSQIRSLAEYVAAAKARPGAIRFGSAGMGATTHLLGEMFMRVADIRIEHVPYRGSAPALQDLLGGTIESMFDPITTNVAMMREGRIRALAISSAGRLAIFPDLPTFAELGYPRMTSSIWAGLSGPKGLAPEIVQRLHAEVVKIVDQPEARRRMDELVVLPRRPALSPEGYTRMIQETIDTWVPVIRSAGIKVD